MDFNRPLWECHLIEGLEDRRFALYMKMHHSLVDGIGGLRMLARMMSLDAKSRDQQPPWAVGAQQRKAKTGERQTPTQAAPEGKRRQAQGRVGEEVVSKCRTGGWRDQ